MKVAALSTASARSVSALVSLWGFIGGELDVGIMMMNPGSNPDSRSAGRPLVAAAPSLTSSRSVLSSATAPAADCSASLAVVMLALTVWISVGMV